MRDDFSEQTKQTLAKRVGMRCSNPKCGKLTSGPRKDPQKTVSIGVASHITAASPKGPRRDDRMAKTERRSISNGIWLCQNCGKLVDNDKERYSAERLRRWKAEAERRASAEIEGKISKSPGKRKPPRIKKNAGQPVETNTVERTVLVAQYILRNLNCEMAGADALVTPNNLREYIARIAALEHEVQTNPNKTDLQKLALELGSVLADEFQNPKSYSGLTKRIRAEIISIDRVLSKDEFARWRQAKGLIKLYADQNKRAKAVRRYSEAIAPIGEAGNLAFDYNKIEQLFLEAVNELNGGSNEVSSAWLKSVYDRHFLTPAEIFPRDRRVLLLAELSDSFLAIFTRISSYVRKDDEKCLDRQINLPTSYSIPEHIHSRVTDAACGFAEAFGPADEHATKLRELAGRIPDSIGTRAGRLSPFDEIHSCFMSGLGKLEAALFEGCAGE